MWPSHLPAGGHTISTRGPIIFSAGQAPNLGHPPPPPWSHHPPTSGQARTTPPWFPPRRRRGPEAPPTVAPLLRAVPWLSPFLQGAVLKSFQVRYKTHPSRRCRALHMRSGLCVPRTDAGGPTKSREPICLTPALEHRMVFMVKFLGKKKIKRQIFCNM